MKKRLFVLVLALIFLIIGSLFLVSCGEDDNISEQEIILNQYTKYVVNMNEKGKTPLSYEDWLKYMHGELEPEPEEEPEEEPEAEEEAEPAPAKEAAPAGPTKVYHLTKRKEDGMWAITFVGGQKAVKLFKTKKEAEAALKVLTENQGATALIRNSKGAKAGKFASSIKTDDSKK